MIRLPEVVVSQLAVARGNGESLCDLALEAAHASGPANIRAVIAATFSNPVRFPALAVRIASALDLAPSTPAFDIQLACSAFPYAVYLAAKLAVDLGGEVLVVDGDVQTPLVNAADHATGHIFSDAVAACHVRVDATSSVSSSFDFLSHYDTALTCDAAGPIFMDGFKVFSFVATAISRFLKPFGAEFDYFAPHQANPYMVRQLAKSLALEDKLLTIDDAIHNPGSCSVAMALACASRPGRALIAGFGAGYSASAGIVTVLPRRA